VYGDTDSLFLSISEGSEGLTTDNIILEAKNKYGVLFELNKKWKILLLTDKQKTYLGITDRDEVAGTTMLGLRSNKPIFFHEVTNYLSSEQSLKRIIDDGPEAALSHIISYVRFVYKNLEDKVRSSDLDFIGSKLAYNESSKKPIYQQSNGWRADIYNDCPSSYETVAAFRSENPSSPLANSSIVYAFCGELNFPSNNLNSSNFC
jgi:hypothetical protein